MYGSPHNDYPMRLLLSKIATADVIRLGADTALGSSLLPIIRTHATVPKSQPTPAVTAIASAPQNITRIAPIVTLAPPA